MVRGKYAKYFKDERQWRYTGETCIHEVEERRWRSEFLAGGDGEECPESRRFNRKATNDVREYLPPDRGGWSVRPNSSSFRTGGHERDTRPARGQVDEGCMKAWRKGALKNPKIMIGAPIDVSNDREVRIAAVLGTLRHSEKALQQASSVLIDNRAVILELLNKDLTALKDASLQSARDRKHLLKDVNEDFTDLRTRARELEVERKILLEDLSDNLFQFDEKAAGVQATRQEMLMWLRKNREELEQRQAELTDDEGLNDVRTHWDWIEQLHEGLLEDRDMIVQQVMKYWPGLNYVAEHIRSDRTVLLEAVKPKMLARTVEDVCRHASQLYFDCEAILDVVLEDSENIENMSRKLRQSHHICNKVIREDWNQLQKTTDEIRADRSFVVAIVENTLSGGKW